jgi:hydrogenase nickel incorporation protein HypA/HybF
MRFQSASHSLVSQGEDENEDIFYSPWKQKGFPPGPSFPNLPAPAFSAPRFTGRAKSSTNTAMHELSIVQSLLDMAAKEMTANKLTKLLRIKVKHGGLTAVVPEAMELGFEVLTRDTPMADAVLELESVPVVLCCGKCGLEFTPGESSGGMGIFSPCPACGEEIGHGVVSGKELFIEFIEAE